MACCKKTKNKSIFEKHGLKPVNIYKWPYAACSGKVNSNGNFVPTTNDEAMQVCLNFCTKQNKISGNRKGSKIFGKLSDINDYDCETQCRMCHDKIVENFSENQKSSDLNFYLCLSGFIIFFILVFIKVIS